MKIASTELALQADQAAQTRQQSTETLRAWRGEWPDFERAGAPVLPSASATASISAAARQAFAAAPVPANAGEAHAIDAAFEAADNDPFLFLVKRMIEMLTGEAVRVFDVGKLSAETNHTEVQAAAVSVSTTSSNGNGRIGFGLEYDYHAVREEFETSRFSAQGVIRTADGQEISFQLELEMTRYYREETSVSLRMSDAVKKDPLVVNFGGTAAQLDSLPNRHFSFDLDSDGRAEKLPLFASGSGYLALDLNCNGRIDSGRELFGPQTGKGFAELARLDADGNGWIDAGDPDFAHLAVWTPAAEGDGTLKTLAELDIGALALAHLATPFALRGKDNQDLGQVKASGLYLTESGKAGSLQEIDLTV